jgi:hypothetical protein
MLAPTASIISSAKLHKDWEFSWRWIPHNEKYNAHITDFPNERRDLCYLYHVHESSVQTHFFKYDNKADSMHQIYKIIRLKLLE